MRQMIKVKHVRVPFRFAGLPVLAFGMVFVLFLGLPSAHAQTPIGTAESCFEAGPDHVPVFTATPVPPVRPGLQAQSPKQVPVATSATTATLVPAGFTPHKALPVRMLNAGSKDRWIPTLRKSPELLISER
jgi:hypothetical protein